MSQTCGDCYYWKRLDQSDTDIGLNEPYFETEANRHYIGYGECALAEMRDGIPEHHGSLAIAGDGEQYTASLYTSPDFGCNQFAPKT